ncbi:ABC transporter permease [Streptosporangium sp. CA-135522]|uniref:ABC transporter permease n=1 Tax=Streptosporangium sp. CA-135522 TaxID=3240072 RepID=UPI003D8FCEF9
MSSLTAAGPAKLDGRRVKRSDFLPYLGSKLAAALVSFLVTLVIGFVIFSLMPSDPVRTLTRGRPTSEAQLARLRVQLGLDDPIWERFLTFVGNTLKGELGYSWQFQQSVSSLVADRLGPTLLLMGTAAVLSIALGLWLGIRSGWRHGGLFDRIASGASLTLWSVPTFWLGMILLVAFSVGVGPIPSLLPAGGMDDPALPQEGLAHVVDVARHLVLPCLTMVLVVFAQYVTVMRTSIIDELGSPYLLTARAKGLTDDAVRRRHAVPNALLPSVTMIFMHLGILVSGAITVEAVYSWPGIGYLTYEALKIPDLPLLQGTFIVFSASVIIMNLLADVVYRFLDPRVRAQ